MRNSKTIAWFASFAAMSLVALSASSALAGPANAAPGAHSTVPVRGSAARGTVPGVPLALGGNVNVTNKNGAQSETTVAVDPTNASHILTASNDLTTTMTVYESTDAGRTWANAGLNLGSAFCYDPWLDFNAAGDAFVAYECSDQRYAYRLQGTSTWVKTTFSSSLAGGFPDRDMIVLDTTSTSPFAGSAYIGYDDNAANNTAYLLYSRDGRTGWTRTPKINDTNAPTIGVNAAVAPDGTVYASWLDFSNKRVMVDRSTDGGAHWSTDHVVANLRLNTTTFFDPIPPTPDRGIVAFPLTDVAPAGTAHAGRLYEAITDKGTSGSDTNVYVEFSDDGGTTWSAESLVNDDGVAAYQFFPAISVASTGKVGVSFYDTRNDPTGKKTDQYISFSGGGATWSANKRVTTAQSDESGNGDANDYGDYEGLDAGPTGKFQVVWTDSRAGAQAEDMFTARVRVA